MSAVSNGQSPIATPAMLQHIASLKMNNNFGDLSNKIAEVHPVRSGTIATLRHGMHNNACLAIIPWPTYLLTAAINAVMVNSPS